MATTKKTTIETVTKSQIRSLRAEAAEAGDSLQVELCDLALGRWSDQPAADAAERTAIAEALAACVDAIADAEAQQ